MALGTPRTQTIPRRVRIGRQDSQNLGRPNRCAYQDTSSAPWPRPCCCARSERSCRRQCWRRWPLWCLDNRGRGRGRHRTGLMCVGETVLVCPKPKYKRAITSCLLLTTASEWSALRNNHHHESSKEIQRALFRAIQNCMSIVNSHQ